jgi:hypothetical protein
VGVAIDMYKFAHKMQINCLTAALDQFFHKNTNATTVLEIYGLYKTSHREIGYPKDILWLPSSGHVDAPKRAARGYPLG